MNLILSKMAGLSIIEDKQHKLSLRLALFPLPLLFCRLSTVFFIDSETNETIPLQFPRCFSFFYEENFSRKTFSLNVCEAALQAASVYKRREFRRETHTPLWLLIGRIIFFQV